MQGQWSNLQLTAPVLEPVLLSIVKKHLAIDHNDEDDAIGQEITAARKLCEKHTGRIFGSRSFRLSLPSWPCDGNFHFPVSPLVSITSMVYLDFQGTQQTVDPSNWRLWIDHNPPLLRLIAGFGYQSTDINAPAGVIVEYIAGDDAPAEMVAQAIRLTVQYWRNNPGGEASLGHLSRGLPAAAIRLLDTLWDGGL